METRLSVVNQCLAIMGEAPLNALTEYHTYRSAILDILDRNDANIQGEGWWFNTEYLALSPSILDGRIHLPTDAVTVRPIDRCPNLVQRGSVLYDVYKGTDVFTVDVKYKVHIVRQVPFDDVPNTVNAYIARKTVLDFQQQYDGDDTRTRRLQSEVYGAPANQYSSQTLGLLGQAKAEHIRNTKVNFIEQSERLSRITNRVDYSRRPR